MLRRTFLATAALSAAAPQGGDSPLEIFVLAGQSNMAGRGAIEPAHNQPAAGVLMLTKDRTWVPAIDPMHFDKPIAAAGLGRSFAARLRQAKPSREIGLVPAAFGGSALDEWMPGTAHYSNCVERTLVALRRGKLRGILWHQGEADSATEALARSYRDRFARFIRSLRSDLGYPETPVIVGQLGPFFRRGESAIVNEQLASVPLTIPNAGFVSASGLTHKGDDVHFDAASLREFGRRYALAYLALDASWESVR